MRITFSSFWWLCAKRAARGASSFANSWQWVVGTPALAFILYYIGRWLGGDVLRLPQNTLGGFEAALAAFVLTWLFKFLIELTTSPFEMYAKTTNENDVLRNKISELLGY